MAINLKNTTAGDLEFSFGDTVEAGKTEQFDHIPLSALRKSGDLQAQCRKDVFGTGLVSLSLVAGRELKTKDVYFGSSLVLPHPPDSKELTQGAVDWLTAVVSLEQDIRPSASHALETLPTG